jgi:ornithine cyclodeaminase/alanine dehydrogenase-like protein (mu-crystallin family)
MTARLGLAVAPAASSAQALAGAHIVCTATTSSTPVFKDSELAPGAHINAVGSWRPTTAEIPADTVARARVFVDQREAAMEEAGELIMPLRAGRISAEHVGKELGELLTGQVPGRQSTEEITLFKSVGLAVQDLFAAARALENACRLGIGLELPR